MGPICGRFGVVAVVRCWSRCCFSTAPRPTPITFCSKNLYFERRKQNKQTNKQQDETGKRGDSLSPVSSRFFVFVFSLVRYYLNAWNRLRRAEIICNINIKWKLSLDLVIDEIKNVQSQAELAEAEKQQQQVRIKTKTNKQTNKNKTKNNKELQRANQKEKREFLVL